MLSCLRLPFSFDPEGLENDLKQIRPEEWVKHFNDRYFEGDWSGVALRAVDGASTSLYSDPEKDQRLNDTPVLSRCPALSGVLSSFDCQVKSARLLKLGAGARIIEHRDYNLSFDDGDVRLHIPITTSSLVAFYVNGERIVMKPGECWYINANLPHKVNNSGEVDRVHVVVDCKVNEWLRSVFESARPKSTEPVGDVGQKGPIDAGPIQSTDAFDRFCNLVLQDLTLQEQLKDVMDKELFFEMVVRLGNERGYHFSVNEVRAAFKARRRAWIQRWI
ncbi:MAG TPA: aspartyl/asparaginyl beta-hydroxylase domain-containing protein [Blastocatellia bacterium]|nr:aspartyl/asparaginyl beta-hydroxylase domain-containing protein [Blastocatellia bacterium]